MTWKRLSTGSLDVNKADIKNIEEYCWAVSSLEGKVGFEWKHCFCEKMLRIGLFYDGIHWFNMFQPLTVGHGEEYEGLTLHSVGLRLGMDF